MTTNITEGIVMSSATAPVGTTPQTLLIKGKKCRQRPLGPAPFASFEDSSDELDSPPETARAPGLPNIKEDPASQLSTPVSPRPPYMNTLNLTEEEEKGLQEALAGGLDTPAPPRIDISRASSSSQHEDSITSSPDHDGHQNLGYKEDGALDLRSSTEELDYTQESGTVEETETRRKRERMMKKQQQLKQDFGDTQSEHEFKQRKDSSCSVASDFGGHLYIGGRTSRLSSVGSAASGGSAASHLSLGSRLSRGSRSPSPHKMMLETSFCGGKPVVLTQTIEVESAPALVSHVEKPTSRPPSRLRSRSPSPHKMLLETSFCGTKTLVSGDKSQGSNKQKARRRSSNTLVPEIRTTAEIAPQPVDVSPPEQPKESNNHETVQEKVLESSKEVKAMPSDEICKANDIVETSRRSAPTHRKPVNLAKMMERKIQQENKPKKKMISIRDIPGDEIFIPLTGPEIDFEEIIRKASPKLARKVEEQQEDSPDVIFIPLHSPPKEKDVEEEIKKQSDSVPESRSANKSPKPYEVLEDGSIFIPLHTPEEEKNSRTFEEEIRRVERELQRVKAAEAERREREKELKPVTLDLSDGYNNRSRLSQSYSGGKPELLSGSRTPSPGSSLSRKSSFASLFRRNELSVSPDSPAGSSIRKKSATLSNIIKDAADGLRDRSRSRSKSKERAPSTGVSRSPSFKKNVFGGLFTKKKESGYDTETAERDVSTMNVQFTFNSNVTFQGEDRGDYIYIPLRDPNVPYTEEPLESVPVEDHVEKPVEVPSPVHIEDIKDSPSLRRKSRDIEEVSSCIETDLLSINLATVGAAYLPTGEGPAPERTAATSIESIHLSSSRQAIEEMNAKEGASVPQELLTSFATAAEAPVEVRSHSPEEWPAALSVPDACETSVPHKLNLSIPESSLELEDETPREEIVTVSTDGVRKLKLPPEPGDLEEDHERKGLVVQDSFEEELPYVPTTLPLERSFGVTLVPAKERVSEVKTCPIDRPRSTTPKNPASLDDYLSRRDSNTVPDKEKMKICLPKDDSTAGRIKSPRKFSGKGKSWFEFAEEGLQNPRELRKGSLTKCSSPPPPPLPPKADLSSTPTKDFTSCAATSPVASWINFEDLPEKRKLPKRITTLPTHRGSADGPVASEKAPAPFVYTYVNPEDCQCECHEHGGAAHAHTKSKIVAGMKLRDRTDGEVSVECDCACEETSDPDLEICPLLDGNSDDDSTSRKDIDWMPPGISLEVEQSALSDSSFEVGSIGADNSPSENAAELIPFAMDLDVHSNRSSIISQNEEPSPEDP